MNLKNILGKVAPFLGSMIGGPFGATAGKLVGELLLEDKNASEADIEKAAKLLEKVFKELMYSKQHPEGR